MSAHEPNPAHVRLLRHFRFDHLPPELADRSRPFAELAHSLVAQPCTDPAELSAGLRKLLEAKDCAVRAVLPSDS